MAAIALVFHLARPYSDFPYLLTGANTWILPAGIKAADWINDPVGAGQFILEKYTAGQGITYKKNPDYWDAASVKLSAVNVTFYSSQQSELLAFQSGQIDQIDSFPAAQAALGTSDRQERSGFTKFDGLTFNINEAPFNDVAVRQAVAWALDRPAIVQTVYGGEGAVGNDFAAFPDYTVQPKGLTARSQNLTEVKKLLGNRVVSFSITTYTDEQTYAQLIQQELNATGNFKVKLDVLTEAAYYADGSTSPWLAAQLYSLIYVASSGWSASHYSSTQLGTLVNQFEASSSATQRQSLANQIATIEWTDVPVIIAVNIATAPFMLLLPASGPGWRLALFATGSFVVLAGAAMSGVITVTFRSTYIPAHLLGRVTAATRFVVSGAIPLGAASAGALATAFGTRTAMWALAILFAVTPLPLLATSMRTLRDFPTLKAPA